MSGLPDRRTFRINWFSVLVLGGGFAYAAICDWFGLIGVIWPLMGIAVLCAIVAWLWWR